MILDLKLKIDSNIADKITDYIFTNGFNEEAVRLHLINETGKNLGGFSKESLNSRIREILGSRIYLSLNEDNIEQTTKVDPKVNISPNHLKALKELGFVCLVMRDDGSAICCDRMLKLGNRAYGWEEVEPNAHTKYLNIEKFDNYIDCSYWRQSLINLNEVE